MNATSRSRHRPTAVDVKYWRATCFLFPQAGSKERGSEKCVNSKKKSPNGIGNKIKSQVSEGSVQSWVIFLVYKWQLKMTQV